MPITGGSSLMWDQSYSGFQEANYAQYELLAKALTAGSGVNAAQYSGGRALSIESLDQTLVNILFTQDEAVLFQLLKKQPVKSVVHQWDTRTEVGSDDGAWAAEADNAFSTDQTISRNYMTVSFLQTLRTVTLQASLTNMIEDAVALEKDAGTRWLIRNVEKGIIYGNTAFVPQQPTGFKYSVPTDTEHTLDLRGQPPNTSTIEQLITQGAQTIRQNYGRGDLLLTSPAAMTDLQALLRDRLRFPPQAQGLGGAIFTEYPTPFGSPKIKEDIFLLEGSTPVASTLTTYAPSAPSIGSITAATGVTGSQFGATDAGQYYYVVVATSKYGDSVASSAVQSAAVASGGSLTLPVTAGATAGTAYKVYRSKVGATSGTGALYAFTVAYTASPQNIVDLNADLPGCSDMYLLTLSPQYNAVEWVQFLPMMKFDLYPTSSAVIPFLMLLFGGMALKKAVQQVRVKNVNPTGGPANGWF